MFPFSEKMQLTFDHLDEQVIDKAVARFRANAEFMALAGIKLRDGERRKVQGEVDAEIVAAICRAWLAATNEPPMKHVQVDCREKRW